MRLIDIKQNIDIAKKSFNPTFPASNGNYYVSNILETKKGIDALIKAHILPTHGTDEEEFLNVIQSAFTDTVFVSSSQQSSFVNFSNRLKFLIATFSIWIDGYITTDEKDTTINIKLPQINGLSDLSEKISLLEKSLNGISTINGGSEVKVEQLDHGSLWIIIAVCSTQIVKALIIAINSALDIAKKKIELDQAKEILKRTQMENGAIENLINIQEKVIEQLIQEQVESTKYKKPEDANGLTEAEQKNRYTKSLTELTKLIVAGTEFYPALCASSEIQDSFPSFKQLERQGPLPELPRQEKDDKDNTKRE